MGYLGVCETWRVLFLPSSHLHWPLCFSYEVCRGRSEYDDWGLGFLGDVTDLRENCGFPCEEDLLSILGLSLETIRIARASPSSHLNTEIVCVCLFGWPLKFDQTPSCCCFEFPSIHLLCTCFPTARPLFCCEHLFASLDHRLRGLAMLMGTAGEDIVHPLSDYSF